jgi:YHS domain-containing protein
MTFIARFLRYLFWVAVVSWTVSLLRRLVNQMAAAHPDGGSNPNVDVPNDSVNQKLVRDPVCGMHLAPGLALQVRHGGESLYFCSPQCREKFLRETPRFAANS